MRFIKILLLFLLPASGYLHAQTFNFNDDCIKAYNTITALKLDEGSALLKAEEKRDPDNLIPVYLENYIDFLSIYTSDTRDIYDRLKKNKDLRLTLLSAGDQNTPYYLFTQAEVNMQWAATNIKFGDYLSAVFEIRKAFKFLEMNEQKFPDFRANKKSLGVLYCLLGTVPDKYKWGITLLGMDGDVHKGITQLNDLVEYAKNNNFIYRDETVVYYAMLLLHLQNEPEAAWKILTDNGFPKKDNLMTVFTSAHVGIYGKHNDEALKILADKPTDMAFAKFPFLDYLTGLGKINRLDADADGPFKTFIASYKGENHIRSSYQKIAWSYLLKGDTDNYINFIKKTEHHGFNTVDVDKQALKEAESKKIPDVNLLRARLLFDGGYYERASAEMNRLNENSFTSVELQTEYQYRLGRIYDEWGKDEQALECYNKAIEKGKDLPRYFAANSAFESGKIYEKQGNKDKASYYYNLCLSFQDHEYKNGLDQKAKAGLNRLK